MGEMAKRPTTPSARTARWDTGATQSGDGQRSDEADAGVVYLPGCRRLREGGFLERDGTPDPEAAAETAELARRSRQVVPLLDVAVLVERSVAVSYTHLTLPTNREV